MSPRLHTASSPLTADASPLHVLHIISGLKVGGAETVLQKLIVNSVRVARHEVVSMTDAGVLGDTLRQAGIPLHALGMPRGRLTLRGMSKLWRILKRSRPNVIQTWMYHADLVGGVTARAMGLNNVVWGVRASELTSAGTSIATRLVVRANAALSRWVPRYIACASERGRDVHQRLGYPKDRLAVIPNGYDVNHLALQTATRDATRANWGLKEGTIAVGCVARWDPLKDHGNLLRSIASLSRKRDDVRCVLAGAGMTTNNGHLVQLIDSCGLTGKVILDGYRSDIAAVMRGLDIHVLASLSEGFPNVVAEAMCCGTPCVVTDVGDAALIVGGCGWVAPPRNEEALTDAMQRAIEECTQSSDRWRLRQAACQTRIAENFSLEEMVRRYFDIWRAASQEKD